MSFSAVADQNVDVGSGGFVVVSESKTVGRYENYDRVSEWFWSRGVKVGVVNEGGMEG